MLLIQSIKIKSIRKQDRAIFRNGSCHTTGAIPKTVFLTPRMTIQQKRRAKKPKKDPGIGYIEKSLKQSKNVQN